MADRGNLKAIFPVFFKIFNLLICVGSGSHCTDCDDNDVGLFVTPAVVTGIFNFLKKDSIVFLCISVSSFIDMSANAYPGFEKMHRQKNLVINFLHAFALASWWMEL